MKGRDQEREGERESKKEEEGMRRKKEIGYGRARLEDLEKEEGVSEDGSKV